MSNAVSTMTLTMMDWVRKRETSNYSVKRLKELYAELLIAVDLADDNNLGRRRHDCELPQSPRRRKKNLLSNDGDDTSSSKLSNAFRLLAATPAAGNDTGDAQAMRDDLTVANMTYAQKLEEHLVKLIRSIGEVVAYGDVAGTSFRSDPIFEYFCEKSMLTLLVEIAKAKPSTNSNLHASTWSPMVKAEVLHTVSILVSNAQDGPSLYYLLSNNCVNELITCMTPLRQWTDPALEIMVPFYVGLLKSLVRQIAASPEDIFTFLKMDDRFPLLSSSLDVATYPKTDSTVRSTCLNLIVTMLKISNPHVRNWISNAETELHGISTFICTRLIDRYNQMAKLLPGPVVDHIRCNAMLIQLTDMMNQIEFLNHLLRSGIQAFNVHFCEAFLRSVVAVLLDNLAPQKNRQFLAVGTSDIDVIPEPEGLAQLAVVFLVHFWSISYPPLIRMLAVALFHQKSTSLWKMAKYNAIKVDYALTRELNSIVQSTEDSFTSNPYRQEVLHLLSGDRGEWRFITASMLVEGALVSPTLGAKHLTTFGLLPDFVDANTEVYPESPLEEALSSFILRTQRTKSAVATMATERASATALSIFSQLFAFHGAKFATIVPSSRLFKAVATAHGRFCYQATEARKKTGVSDLFVDFTQLAIRSRYPKLSRDPVSRLQYGCVFEHFGYQSVAKNPSILVRRFRTVGSNDVEDCRFAIQMALQFRATCQVITSITKGASQTSFPTTDWADDLLLSIGDLNDKPVIGTDLDLRGRMGFNFHATTSNAGIRNRFPQPKIPDQVGSASELILRSTSQLVLVLDPTDIFVVQPVGRREVNRGTILCCVSLRKIIAFASDEEWLHIAIRNMDDVGFLIKNGNMALHFDTIGTSLIVKQYLERSQNNLRGELKDQIEALFEERFLLPDTNDISSGDTELATTVNV
jgi:Uncharacterised conserved protein